MGKSLSQPHKNSLIWDWPLRIWHWLLFICVSVALVTGLVSEWDLMDLHRWMGMSVVALLFFRLLWSLCGGTYSRFRKYFTTPKSVVDHFRGRLEPKAHTPPGILLALTMFIALGTQAIAGLFTTDDVFQEGPLVQFVSDEFVEVASDLHHRIWWFVVALIGVHLVAHFVYAVFLRSSIPLSMFTGRKPTTEEPTQYSIWRAAACYGLAFLLFLVLLYYSR